jgi:hypothetical protein
VNSGAPEGWAVPSPLLTTAAKMFSTVLPSEGNIYAMYASVIYWGYVHLHAHKTKRFTRRYNASSPHPHPHIKYGSYAIEYRRKIAEFVDKHL